MYGKVAFRKVVRTEKGNIDALTPLLFCRFDHCMEVWPKVCGVVHEHVNAPVLSGCLFDSIRHLFRIRHVRSPEGAHPAVAADD
jgi:hypothetical protein